MKTADKFIASLDLPTQDGVFLAHYSEAGLARLDFPGKKSRSPAPAERAGDCIDRWHRATGRALESVLQGGPATNLPPLDLSRGTVFQKSVWAEMQRIPFGKTTTYGAIASAVGKPAAARAVGAACGANPVPLLIPCHRVVAAGGKLGGYLGGAAWKQKLLQAEQRK